MRLVKFKCPDSAVSYPAEGIKAFGNTVRVDDHIIGEYHGYDSGLDDYDGNWPIQEITNKTVLTCEEFDSLFLEDEKSAIYREKDNDHKIFDFWVICRILTDIDLEDGSIIYYLNYLASVADDTNGLPNQERVDTILSGMVVAV